VLHTQQLLLPHPEKCPLGLRSLTLRNVHWGSCALTLRNVHWGSCALTLRNVHWGSCSLTLRNVHWGSCALTLRNVHWGLCALTLRHVPTLVAWVLEAELLVRGLHQCVCVCVCRCTSSSVVAEQTEKQTELLVRGLNCSRTNNSVVVKHDRNTDRTACV